MSRLPSLHAIRYFAVAARTLSFTAAARELNVTQGAVSRMVQSLEEELATPLFARNGRFIVLTDAGSAFYADIAGALAEIERASDAVRRKRADTPLSLVVTTGFATRWLVPRLPEFSRANPGIQVDILGNDPDDASYGANAQIVVRYGAPPWPSSVATRIPLGGLGVVCAPELVALSPVREPADLIGRPLLTHTAEERDLWGEYLAHFGLTAPDLGSTPRFNQLLMLAEAAASGLGFALVPLFLYDSELRSGRLVQAIPHVYHAKRGYFLTHAKGRESDAKVQAFMKWIMKAARETPGAD